MKRVLWAAALAAGVCSGRGSAVALDNPPAAAADRDADGDGLPDFQELHKYGTNPDQKDTAGDGTLDGDWQQRREFNYSTRAVIRVMRPYNLAALDDDYQDIRLLKETDTFAELEVVAYPLNTNAETITGNSNWQKDDASLQEYLRPGVTTNWDDAMRAQLLGDLRRDGIDPDHLTDKEVVVQVSRWLFQHSRQRDMFCTFYVEFKDGRPAVLRGLEEMFQRDKGDSKWTVEQQFEHELFGRQMFANRTYGTCTSTAAYQTTVLRALGIPTRIILCIPLADGSDVKQIELLEKGLTNHRVRQAASLGAMAGGDSFASHTFCEVFVGGRWRRLNYTKLGQNILEPRYLGLMIHVHTFNDLSTAGLSSWGNRYANGYRDEAFPRVNPYRLLEVSDHFGKHAKISNPPADNEHRRLTITRAYWPGAKDTPAEVGNLGWRHDPAAGQFFVHAHEWFDNAGDHLQYKPFMRRADPQLLLRAEGHPEVRCRITNGFYTYGAEKLREFEVIIPPEQYAKMARGVAYSLQPAGAQDGYGWTVREVVQLTRE